MNAVRKIILAAALLALSVPAFAQRDLSDGKWWKRPWLAAEINLTDEQSREIEKIFVRGRTRLIDLKADLEKKQVALQSSMEDQTADRRTVEKQIEAVENARAELQKARAVMLLDMKQVLKPGQWERLRQLQQEIRERRMMQKEGLSDGYGPGKGRPQARPKPPRGD